MGKAANYPIRAACCTPHPAGHRRCVPVNSPVAVDPIEYAQQFLGDLVHARRSARRVIAVGYRRSMRAATVAVTVLPGTSCMRMQGA